MTDSANLAVQLFHRNLHRSLIDADEVVVVLSGEIDMSTCTILEEQISLAFEHTLAAIIIDMANIEFIDASGIAILVGASGRAKDQGRHFALRRPSRAVRRLVAIFKLDEVLPIDHLEDSWTAFNG